MAQELWTKVDRYITELLLPPDSILEGVLETNAAADLPPHDVLTGVGFLQRGEYRLKYGVLIHKASTV